MSGQAQDDVYLKLVMDAFDEHIPQFDISDRKYDAFKQSVADTLHSALAEKDTEIARLKDAAANQPLISHRMASSL